MEKGTNIVTEEQIKHMVDRFLSGSWMMLMQRRELPMMPCQEPPSAE